MYFHQMNRQSASIYILFPWCAGFSYANTWMLHCISRHFMTIIWWSYVRFRNIHTQNMHPLMLIVFWCEWFTTRKNKLVNAHREKCLSLSKHTFQSPPFRSASILIFDPYTEVLSVFMLILYNLRKEKQQRWLTH